MAVRARVQRLEERRSAGGVSWLDWHRELRLSCRSGLGADNELRSGRMGISICANYTIDLDRPVL